VYRIAIVDDADDLRYLLETVIAINPGFEICGTGGSGKAAIAIAGDEHPDVMLLDVSMPDMSGPDAVPRILERSPATRIFLLSGWDADDYADSVAALGVAGFFEKDGHMIDLPDRLLALLDSERDRQ
jgi:DNA-binding NarL/FixJ family response regulator